MDVAQAAFLRKKEEREKRLKEREERSSKKPRKEKTKAKRPRSPSPITTPEAERQTVADIEIVSDQEQTVVPQGVIATPPIKQLPYLESASDSHTGASLARVVSKQVSHNIYSSCEVKVIQEQRLNLMMQSAAMDVYLDEYYRRMRVDCTKREEEMSLQQAKWDKKAKFVVEVAKQEEGKRKKAEGELEEAKKEISRLKEENRALGEQVTPGTEAYKRLTETYRLSEQFGEDYMPTLYSHYQMILGMVKDWMKEPDFGEDLLDKELEKMDPRKDIEDSDDGGEASARVGEDEATVVASPAASVTPDV